MEDRSRRLAEPLRWTRGGRLAVIAAAICLLVCVVGAGTYGLIHGFSTPQQAGCIDVLVPSTLGGANVHACDRKAKLLCATPGNAGLAGNDSLRSQCRREGYAFGAS